MNESSTDLETREPIAIAYIENPAKGNALSLRC